MGEPDESNDSSISNQIDYESIEDLFDEQTHQLDEFEDVSLSSCVYEPVLVSLKEKKLESRLDKSFYPQYDEEITIIDTEDNSLTIPIDDLHYLSFVNLPLQIDLLKINDFSEVVKTINGDSFRVRIPRDQNSNTGFFGLIEKPEDRYKYIFFPYRNIKIQYQQRPIGDIILEKNFLTKDTLNNVLRRQNQLRSIRLGSIIAKRASLQPHHIEKALQNVWENRPEKKLRFEKERLRKEATERLLVGQRLLKKEANKKLQVEEERFKKEAEEKLLQKQEELRNQAEEKKRTVEERLMKEIDEKLSQEKDKLQKEINKKMRLEEEKLNREADEKLLQKREELKKEVEAKKRAEEERLDKDIDKQLSQEENELKKEVEAKKRAEEERLRNEIEKKTLNEKERLTALVKKKLLLEEEWLKTDKVEKAPTGDILIEAGIVTPQTVKQSLAIQKKIREMKLGELSIEMGLVNEEQMCKVLAEKFNKRFVNLQKTTPTEDALNCLPRDLIKKLKIVPIDLNNERLIIATSTPDKNDLIDILHEKLSCTFELVVSPQNQIIETLSNLPD
ncbi:hypothetical protein ACFLZ5_08310 [Thermodesulfobacteriota bacterium]